MRKARLQSRNLAVSYVCVYACLFLLSAHYWAPTALNPDGKPFDKKLTKVSLCLPTVNVFNQLFYGGKLLLNISAENVDHFGL